MPGVLSWLYTSGLSGMIEVSFYVSFLRACLHIVPSFVKCWAG